MPDEIVTTPEDTEKKEIDEVETPSEPTAEDPVDAHDDPSSAKEAEASVSEPETHVDPAELGDGDESPSAEASEASEEASLPSDPVPASEDPHALGVDTGSDAPLVPEDDKEPEETKEPEKADETPEWVPPYTDGYEDAKGVLSTLGEDRAADLKDAANALFHVLESLIDKDLSGLDGQSGAILANVRNHGAGFLAATEAVLKRRR